MSTTSTKSKKIRCEVCTRKLKLVDSQFQCKCDKKLCSKHRGVDKHECTFDHSAKFKEVLSNRLIKTQSVKLEKI